MTREYTIHLAKRLHGISFKKRAPRAVKEVKEFAKKMMGTVVRALPREESAVWTRVVWRARGLPLAPLLLGGCTRASTSSLSQALARGTSGLAGGACGSGVWVCG